MGLIPVPSLEASDEAQQNATSKLFAICISLRKGRHRSTTFQCQVTSLNYSPMIVAY